MGKVQCVWKIVRVTFDAHANSSAMPPSKAATVTTVPIKPPLTVGMPMAPAVLPP